MERKELLLPQEEATPNLKRSFRSITLWQSKVRVNMFLGLTVNLNEVITPEKEGGIFSGASVLWRKKQRPPVRLG
jgi:hypothetical protein